MQTLTVVKGPSLADIQIAAARFMLSSDAQPVPLEFTVEEPAEGDTKTPVQRTMHISGFYRHQGSESAWSLTQPLVGDHAPAKLTKLHYYPDIGRGRIEVFDEDD